MSKEFFLGDNVEEELINSSASLARRLGNLALRDLYKHVGLHCTACGMSKVCASRMWTSSAKVRDHTGRIGNCQSHCAADDI
jgi:hypothetical protein